MDLLLQLLWNGIVTGSLIALVALGLTLIYGVGGFLQFAHGELVAVGAYSFMVSHKYWGWPVVPALLLTLGVTLLVGLLIERVFFRPLRDRDALIPLVVSIGLSIGIQALILIGFGAGILTISDGAAPNMALLSGHLLATPVQIIALVTSLLLMLGLQSFLTYTRPGKMLRAVSSNRSLASMFGLSADSAMRWIFGIGTVLAAVAGVFLGYEQNLEPTMGVQIGIMAFAALILGAVGSVPGAIVGAYIIGILQSLLVGYGVIPSGFTAAIPFVVLILMLLVKPAGLFGTRFTAIRH
ncbi:branched-chain amino acid ABC transporter permease [Candidatus Peribacteria bacterium]|nr:branched-chain amino acid ABC transporter permease [Candidatus Peribacteria bacterium]